MLDRPRQRSRSLGRRLDVQGEGLGAAPDEAHVDLHLVHGGRVEPEGGYDDRAGNAGQRPVAVEPRALEAHEDVTRPRPRQRAHTHRHTADDLRVVDGKLELHGMRGGSRQHARACA